MLAIDGEPRDARFEDLPQYPTLARPSQSDDQPRYYGFGTLAVDGHLYQFLSTLERPVCISELRDADPGKPFYFGGVKLIYSPDNGRTWHNQDGSTPVVWDRWDRRSRQTMLFFEEDQQAFSLISVLQMGRNYEHNRDGYVYVYSPNGKTEGTMNELVMFRVPKDRIRDRNAYEYFAGFQSGLAKWNSDIAARKPTCTFPRGWVNKFTHPFAWQPSVVYNPALGVYVMANWGMGSGNGVLPWADVTVDNLHWFAKPSYLGFWIAQDPWGPWTQIHEETVWKPGGDAGARAYEPQIAPKWIAADGKSFWLVWTDYQVLRDGSSLQQVIAARKGAADPCVWSEDDVRRYVEAVRTDMPYYSFNVQRVDFLIS